MELIKATVYFRPEGDVNMRNISQMRQETIYLNPSQIVCLNSNYEVTLNSALESLFGKFADKLVVDKSSINLPR